MKFLVGVLYCGENEFDSCIDSIEQQQNSIHSAFVIKNKIKRDAHKLLYNTFMSQCQDFDIFVKVDADMVLARNNLFESIGQYFSQRNWLHHLQIPVEDWYSLRLIGALHSFRSNVQWGKTRDNVFTDRSPTIPRQREYHEGSLSPAAYHCPNPTPYQSFHYGIHRGVKLRVALATSQLSRAKFHFKNRELTWTNFVNVDDPRRGWASLGYEIAIIENLQPHHMNYHDAEIRQLWLRKQALVGDRLIRELETLRLENFEFFARKGLSTKTSSVQ